MGTGVVVPRPVVVDMAAPCTFAGSGFPDRLWDNPWTLPRGGVVDNRAPDVIPEDFLKTCLLVGRFPDNRGVASPAIVRATIEVVARVPAKSFSPYPREATTDAVSTMREPEAVVPETIFIGVPRSPYKHYLVLTRVPTGAKREVVREDPFVRSGRTMNVSGRPVFRLTRPSPP